MSNPKKLAVPKDSMNQEGNWNILKYSCVSFPFWDLRGSSVELYIFGIHGFITLNVKLGRKKANVDNSLLWHRYETMKWKMLKYRQGNIVPAYFAIL